MCHRHKETRAPSEIRTNAIIIALLLRTSLKNVVVGGRTKRCFVLRCLRWTGKQWFMENTFCVIFLRAPPATARFPVAALLFYSPIVVLEQAIQHPHHHQHQRHPTTSFLSSWFWCTYDCCTPPHSPVPAPATATTTGQWRRICFRACLWRDAIWRLVTTTYKDAIDTRIYFRVDAVVGGIVSEWVSEWTNEGDKAISIMGPALRPPSSHQKATAANNKSSNQKLSSLS